MKRDVCSREVKIAVELPSKLRAEEKAIMLNHEM